MKIGMVSKYPPEEDGLGIYNSALCKELEDAGIEVIKIGDKESATADYRTDFKSLFLKWQLQKIIENEKLDVLHMHYVPSYFSRTLSLNLAVALIQQVPVIVTMHEISTETDTLPQKARAFVQKMITGKASAVITHSRQQKEFLHMKHKKKQAHLIRIGLSQKPAHQLKDKNVLLFGTLSYRKGAEYAIRAMDYLPDYRLTVAGSAANPHYEELIRKAASENRMGNVKLDIRWIPEEAKDEYYRKADIVVLPYVQAPHQSGVLHDAFSHGIPAVVSDAGIIGEVVKDFRCGRVVEQRSPKAIASGIRGVLGSYEVYQHGISKYGEEANMKKVAEKHAELYNETLQEYYDTHGIMEKEKEQKELLAESINSDEEEI